VARYIESKKEFELSWYNLEGLTQGKAVTLYHGSTRSFKKFDLSLVREDLVKNYYGGGIFLTPSKRVAWKYAGANRNIGFDPSIIEDLKRKNKNAGWAFELLCTQGSSDETWDTLIARAKEEYPDMDPAPALDKYLGVDPNTLVDVAAYVIGSKVEVLGGGDPVNIFNMSSGAPSYIYNDLDEIGIDSKEYRPKVYTVSVTVKNPLITDSKAKAKSARNKGYDSVVFYGSSLVEDVPEVAVFSPNDVKIQKVEYDD
jgi:hypothetical protein